MHGSKYFFSGLYLYWVDFWVMRVFGSFRYRVEIILGWVVVGYIRARSSICHIFKKHKIVQELGKNHA